MAAKKESLYAELKRVFHEPSRLAIMSALAGETDGLTFNELKDECGLTFGNLSSHLKTLQDAGVIAIRKFFVGNKPCTQVCLTEAGRQSFINYLQALEEVLKKAEDAVSKSVNKAGVAFSAKSVTQT
ncbi:MAG: transcriptional regulator [bacterium]